MRPTNTRHLQFPQRFRLRVNHSIPCLDFPNHLLQLITQSLALKIPISNAGSAVGKTSGGHSYRSEPDIRFSASRTIESSVSRLSMRSAISCVCISKECFSLRRWCNSSWRYWFLLSNSTLSISLCRMISYQPLSVAFPQEIACCAFVPPWTSRSVD